MSEDRLGTLMVAFYANAGHETNFTGEVVAIADHPTLYFKPEGDACQRHWAAHLCRKATKNEQIGYWKARALRDSWDGEERRDGNDRRHTYGRRDVDGR